MALFKKIIHFPFFSILIGFFPLLALWNGNKSQIQTRDTWFSLVITLAFVVMISIIIFLIFKNRSKSSLGLSLFFLLFFTFGHTYDLIQRNVSLSQMVGFVKLLVAYAILFIIAMVLILRTRGLSASTVVILNGVMTILCLFNLLSIVSYNLQARSAKESFETDNIMPAVSQGAEQTELADIYYIVLDAYSRQDVLLDLMDYDNTPFINALKERGIYVADCANANYGGTVASMASSLNYDYLDLETVENENHINLTEMLINNRIRSDLKGYGYQFVTTRGFSSENDIPNSDVYLDVMEDQGQQDKIAQNRFTRLYYETTLLRVPIELYQQDPVRYSRLPGWLILADQSDGVLGYATYWYNQTNYVFDSLKEFPQKEGNYFVYAHINLPHGPYVFDEQGNFNYIHNPEDNIPPYKTAITYANKRTLDLINSLIANSDVPPLIILQGDHAAHEITTGFDKNKILNAFYFPEGMKEELYPTITPVNTFRLILRDYFNQPIDLLPDQVYAKEFNDFEYRPSTCE